MKYPAVIFVLIAGMLAGCSGGAPEATKPSAAETTTPSAETPAPPKTTAPATTSELVPFRPSGNYGADLAAAGIVPDDVQRYGQFMTEELCEMPLTKHKVWDRSEFSESIRRLSSSESDDVAMIRISVAYFCPERAALAEVALKEHGYIE